MRWRGRRGSDNVEYRGSGGGGPPMMKLGGGLGSIILILILVFVFKVDPAQLLNDPQLQQGGGGGGPAQQVDPAQTLSPQQQELAAFAEVVLADTEDVWNELFKQDGSQYIEPKLVVFSERVQSACGFASAASGPFYCPADQKVYIDLSFYQELEDRFDAPGDFAQAYVLAHEVGHHVQNLMGITDQVHSRRGALSEAEYNDLSVRLELQADFLAGVWAHHAQRTKNILEPGDIEEALNAATAIGDDRLQKQSQGYVVPESFTHGTSEQRMRWFRKGYESGDINQGNTFEAREL
ncbi:MAG: neutral zinc metallopeptidase [Planctomycetaceae bacterium]|nr:neutral zinc metallopeptidase [Planctomycetaceae bacterium]